ncbi:MAG TPA: hypothetical protein VL995_06460 [Cellvibrio sp.]|nr:hypothetical protein [Cellvibrio sp.]
MEYYIDDWSCTNESCALLMPIELGDAVFITATSAIISGSIAVVGNTMYWLERQDTCPFNDSLEKKSPEQPSENINDPYQIREEIITAKS